MFGEKECFIVAEIGASHNQDFGEAIKLVQAAQSSGANAVKVQMYNPDSMASPDDPPIKTGPWQNYTLYELYKNTCMPYDWVPLLKSIAEKLGLFFFTTVYDPETVCIAEKYNIPAYKIASYEITWLDFIEKVAATNKPIFMSTGMAEYHEIWAAIKAIRKYHKNFYLMHCVSEYPALPEQMNLRTLYDLSRYCMGRVGLSDHSKSIAIPAVAVSMGARVIEKHLKINECGADAGFALTEHEFAQMVKAIRQSEKAIGCVYYGGKKRYRRKLIGGQMLRSAE